MYNMCIYVHIYTHECNSISVHIYMYTDMHISIHIYFACMDVIYVCTCMHVHLYTVMYVHLYTYLNIYIIMAYMLTHTKIHAYIDNWMCVICVFMSLYMCINAHAWLPTYMFIYIQYIHPIHIVILYH